MNSEDTFKRMRDIIQKEMKEQGLSADDVRNSIKDQLRNVAVRAEQRKSENNNSEYSPPYDEELGNAQLDTMKEENE